MFAHKKIAGARGTYVDDPLSNIVHNACLLALYGSTMHLVRQCGTFGLHLASVWSP